MQKSNQDNQQFRIGQRVRVISGPFRDFPGRVAAIDAMKSEVRVTVNFFGKNTALKLGYVEVETV